MTSDEFNLLGLILSSTALVAVLIAWSNSRDRERKRRQSGEEGQPPGRSLSIAADEQGARFGPSLHEHGRHLLELLIEIGYPAAHRTGFVDAMRPHWDDTRKAERTAREWLEGRAVSWSAYDRRLAELGVISDAAAEHLGDDALDAVKTAHDVGLSLPSAVYSAVLMRAYAEHRYRQVREGPSARPHVRFRCQDAMRDVPVGCVKRDGQVAPVGSSILPALPCWRPDCRCYIEALSDDDLARGR